LPAQFLLFLFLPLLLSGYLFSFFFFLEFFLFLEKILSGCFFLLLLKFLCFFLSQDFSLFGFLLVKSDLNLALLLLFLLLKNVKLLLVFAEGFFRFGLLPFLLLLFFCLSGQFLLPCDFLKSGLLILAG